MLLPKGTNSIGSLSATPQFATQASCSQNTCKVSELLADTLLALPRVCRPGKLLHKQTTARHLPAETSQNTPQCLQQPRQVARTGPDDSVTSLQKPVALMLRATDYCRPGKLLTKQSMECNMNSQFNPLPVAQNSCLKGAWKLCDLPQQKPLSPVWRR